MHDFRDEEGNTLPFGEVVSLLYAGAHSASSGYDEIFSYVVLDGARRFADSLTPEEAEQFRKEAKQQGIRIDDDAWFAQQRAVYDRLMTELHDGRPPAGEV